MTAEMEAVVATVTGEVQGVGFRWWCQAEAQRRGVRGWVSNRYDGSVEAWLEGDPQGVREMILWLHEGPRWAEVRDVTIRKVEPSGIRGFSVR